MWHSNEETHIEDKLNFDKFLKGLDEKKPKVSDDPDEDETFARKLDKKYREDWRNRVTYNG
jgi:hypothetical protein